jgi:DNA-binding transcriptional MerR regulator/effector-binding domain-containing protein
MDNTNSYFSIGAFAQLCDTTRDTLYHYEKCGILLPSINERNGYRFYTCRDYYTYMFIAHLTRIGFSLSDIRLYLSEHNIENYLTAIRMSETRYYQEIERLQLRNKRTQRGYEALLKIINEPLNVPQIAYVDEEYFVRLPFDGNFEGKSCVECQSAHVKYASAHGIDIQRHFLGFYMNTAFSGSEQKFDSVITKMVSRVECDHLFVKPAGVYLVMAYRGPYHEDQNASYAIVREYLDTHRFTPLTGVFVVEAVGPFFSDNRNEYIAELSIRIE